MVRGLNITVDYYNIKIKDRITLTENLQGQDIRDALTKAGLAGSSARFFINGIDTRTQGLDVVASYRLPDMGIGKLTLTAGYNLNDTKITARSEEHTSELQSLMRTSYAVFCLKKKTHKVQQ